jgi:hypothetical protein
MFLEPRYAAKRKLQWKKLKNVINSQLYHMSLTKPETKLLSWDRAQNRKHSLMILRSNFSHAISTTTSVSGTEVLTEKATYDLAQDVL